MVFGIFANKRAKGFAAEDVAVDYLRKHKCRILKRNYQTRRGEVDIIALDGDVVVFVEVRLRDDIDRAAESITPAKQKRIAAAAADYLARMAYPASCRFDAVLVDNDGNVRWVKDAFGV